MSGINAKGPELINKFSTWLTENKVTSLFQPKYFDDMGMGGIATANFKVK